MTTSNVKFESISLKTRIITMLKVDLRRMFTMPLFYIMVGVSAVIPVLVLVMTSMMAGTPSVDPVTGVETTMASFENVWQTLGSTSDSGAMMSMDLVGMCNINMIYFLIAILVCLFISDDFRSGYAKNLFAMRSKKTDYVISKTVVGVVGGVAMILGYFVGAMLGGGIASLSFEVVGATAGGIVACIFSKIFIVAVFVPIFVVMSVVAKQKSWLSILLSLGASMLLFTMIPMISPLDSTFLNVILCLAGGVLLSVGLGSISNVILQKTSLV
ncbi:MAG: ABC transporter permease [Clostridia bacterium]|nr:ABC transporter permease [Clostridia bacterium]